MTEFREKFEMGIRLAAVLHKYRYHARAIGKNIKEITDKFFAQLLIQYPEGSLSIEKMEENAKEHGQTLQQYIFSGAAAFIQTLIDAGILNQSGLNIDEGGFAEHASDIEEDLKAEAEEESYSDVESWLSLANHDSDLSLTPTGTIVWEAELSPLESWLLTIKPDFTISPINNLVEEFEGSSDSQPDTVVDSIESSSPAPSNSIGLIPGVALVPPAALVPLDLMPTAALAPVVGLIPGVALVPPAAALVPLDLMPAAPVGLIHAEPAAGACI